MTNPSDFVMQMAIVLGSITVHEFAHAKSADMAGDMTPRLYGRVTLNPTRHFEPMGLFMIFFSSLAGFGFGWGKPVPIDPRKMRSPRWDSVLVTAWGPFSNLLIALGAAVLLRLAPTLTAQGIAGNFLLLTIVINLTLAFFNLIPLFPLDGSWILQGLLPERFGFQLSQWNRRYGAMVLLTCLLVLPLVGLPVIEWVLMPPVMQAFRILVG
ncbi:MAG: site-2 protease family protein [Fimbriimonadales bacterium]